MKWIKKVVDLYRKKARLKRKKIFIDSFNITEETKILDLGSENGRNISFILDGVSIKKENIYIADIDEAVIKEGQKLFGFNPVLINENGSIPFDDKFFDIVYCSSVIEHVTVPKDLVWSTAEPDRFVLEAKKNQQRFANEINRIGKEFFIQTPNKNFLIESHSWLPFLGFVSHTIQIQLLKFSNKFWIKKTVPDFYLLDKTYLSYLFPDSIIKKETSAFMVKSIMAIKSSKKI